MSSRLLLYKIRFTLLYNNTSDYDALHAFGCLAYTTSFKRQRTKLDPRFHKCIYLGLGNQYGVKVHVLLDINNKQLFMSRDTIFFEHLFPYNINH